MTYPKQYFRYINKNYLIYKGARGGLYIVKNNRKKYIKTIKIQSGGNNTNFKSINITANINGIKRAIYTRKNVKQDINKLTKIFDSCQDINEHIEFMSKLSEKNKWFYSDNRTGKTRYYGTCFEWDIKKNSYVKKKKYSISDVMESWLNEQLSIECKFALLIFWFLKIYRKYGKKINSIVKDIDCRKCKTKPFGLNTSSNIDGKPLIISGPYLYMTPQQNTIETNNLFNNKMNYYTFGYIRSNFGYLSIKKLGSNHSNHFTMTSPQGHNFMMSCYNNKPRLCVFGPIDIYEPNLKIDNPENAFGKYIIIDDIQTFLDKAFSEGTKVINESVQMMSSKIPKKYTVNVDNITIMSKKYNDWYGMTQVFNKYINLPKNF